MTFPQQPFQRPTGAPNPYGPRAVQSSFGGWGGAGRPGGPVPPHAPQGFAPPPSQPGFAQPGPQGFQAPPRPPQGGFPGSQPFRPAPQQPFQPGPQGPFGAPGAPQAFQAPGQFRPPYQTGPQFGGPGPYGPRPYGPPPGQFGPYPGYRQPQQRKPIGLLLAIAGCAVALAGLLAMTLVGGGPGRENQVASGYQNEEYELPGADVPPIEIPMGTDEAKSWAEANAIYDQALASPVRCEVAVKDDIHDLSVDELEAHLDEFTACLTRVWGPALEAAGFEAYIPEMTVYPAGGTVTTACGSAESHNAFYCSKDQAIYLAPDVLDLLPKDTASARSVFELIIAHEYGHAVQGRTGILGAFRYQIYEAETEAEALQVGRRNEVQADCLAGLALNSLSESMGINETDRAQLAEVSYEIGDDRVAERFDLPDAPGDHGTGEARRLWMERGLAEHAGQTCNSYVAPVDEVQ